MADEGDQDLKLKEFERRLKEQMDRLADLAKLEKQDTYVSDEISKVIAELEALQQEVDSCTQRVQAEADKADEEVIEILRKTYRNIWAPCLRKHGRKRGSERVVRTPMAQMNYAAPERLLSEPKKFGDVEIIGDVGAGKLGVQRTGRHGRHCRGASLVNQAGAQTTIGIELECVRTQLKPNVRFAGLREWREVAERCDAAKNRFQTLLRHRDTYLFPGALFRNCEGQLSVPALWWEGEDIRMASAWLGCAWEANMALVLVETT